MLYEVFRGKFNRLELTLADKNFLAMYENSSSHHTPICRAENIRFKADLIRTPSIPVDWHQVEMHNWNQSNSEINGIKVQVNVGNQSTMEFIPDLLMAITRIVYE